MNLLPRQKQEVGGSIAYHQLTNWWLTNFTEEERIYIAHCYQPWGKVPYSLIEGETATSSQSTAALLVDITRYLHRPEDLFLVRRILDKAEQEAMHVGDVSILDEIYRALMNAIMFTGRTLSYRSQPTTRSSQLH